MFDRGLYFSALRTGITGREFEYLDSVTSTMDYLLEKSFRQGRVVAAGAQTGGRGRNGRKWITQEDGLAFSVCLPVENASDLMKANVLCAFAVCDALSPYAPVKIKWPNDCVAGGRKICGMLIDASFAGTRLEKAVFGAGINLGRSKIKGESMAASVGEFFPGSIAREKVLADVMNGIENRMRTLVENVADLRSEWSVYSACLGKDITLHVSGRKIRAKELGITEDGTLEAEINGERRVISCGEIGYDFGV